MNDRGYTNPELLVTPEALYGRLNDPAIRVVDTRAVYEYAAGHIPGAIHLNFYGISLNNTSPEAFDAFMWTLSSLMADRGIGSEQTVVFYESTMGSRSARGFWICEYLGHGDVHVLNGGFQAWTGAGYPVTTACPYHKRPRFRIDSVSDRHIGAEPLRDSLGREGFALLDVRSDDEYYGRIARAARGGAIPGAVHIEYLQNMDSTGAMKPADELRTMYERAGVMPEQTVACY